MLKQLKRQHVIKQLNKLDIHSIDGQPLDEVLYSTLLKVLVHKRSELD